MDNKDKKAIDDFTQVLTLDSVNVEALVRRGSVYDKLQDYYNAMKDYKNAERLNPKDVDVLFLKAMLCEKLNYMDEAILAYRKYVQLAPKGDKDLKFARNKLSELIKR